MYKFALRISVFALAAVGAFAQTNLPAVVIHTTGMIGIAEGETARFNALNPGLLPPATGANCPGVLTFYGPEGGVLKTTTVNVAPGQAQYLDLFASSDLSLIIGERKQIRATITVPAAPSPASTSASATPAPNGPQAACRLIGTLEILDSGTGRTQVVIGAAHDVPSSTN